MDMINLLKDAQFRKYFLTNPRLPYKLADPNPWTVWIHRTSQKTGRLVWARVDMPTFKDAWTYARANYKGWKDFSITSRIIGFDPPKNIRNAFELNDWCYRCRRPVEMRAFAKHHALKQDIHQYFADWPVCPYCGSSGPDQYTLVPG